MHHNKGATKLLKVPSPELQWRRLSEGGNLLCSADVVLRLRDVVVRGHGDQFELDNDDRSLRLSVTAFGDILSLTISDVTDATPRAVRTEAARGFVPPAVRQQPDADVGIRRRDHGLSQRQ